MTADGALLHLFAQALGTTAILAVTTAIGALIWGALLYFIASGSGGLGKFAVGAYVQLLRNTPVLLPIYLIYFGFPMIGLVWSAEVCGVIALVLQQGAYVSEILRGSAKTIDRAQHDASLSIGISDVDAFPKGRLATNSYLLPTCTW